MSDLRYAFRGLARTPAFTVAAVLTLALGIGASTAIFSVVHAVLLKSLPYREPDRLVRVWETDPPERRTASDRRPVSPVNFVAWRRDPELFDDIAATTAGNNQNLTLTGAGAPIKLLTDHVSSSFFRVVGVQPILGRAFVAEEEQPGRDQVVVLSHDLWQSVFGGDPDVIGRTVTLDGMTNTVVGVMPPGFRSPDRITSRSGTLLLRPLTFGELKVEDRGAHFLSIIARLKPDSSLPQTQLKLTAMARQVERDVPEMKGWGVRLVSLQDDLVVNVRQTLFVLLGAVGCVLFIACANVANLLLARVTNQSKELAVRAALGASRLRLIRELLTYSLLLALIGGALGMVLAIALTDVFLRIGPANIPRLNEARIDLTVLGFALLMSILTGLFFGTVPALRASKPAVNDALNKSGRTSTDASAGTRLRNVLVVAQVAVALVLVIQAGLLINTFRQIQAVDPGFRSENVLAMEIAPPPSKYARPFERVAFFQQVLERVEALPGVRSAAVVSHFPLAGSSGGGFVLEGRTPSDPREWDAEFRSASPDYFRTMGIPLLEGRSFTAQDAGSSMPVAVINKAMAQRFWPNESPLGNRIRRGRAPVDIPWLTIVGIVGDVKHQGPTRETYLEVYVPYTQPSWAGLSPSPFPFPRELVVRTDGDPRALVPILRKQVWAIDKDQPVAIRMPDELLHSSVSRQRFNMLLFGAFGAVGLLLAAVGIYGVLSFVIARRTHEIGIRMAVGAERGRILALVISQGMTLVVLGVAIGVVAALVLTRVTSTLLFGVTPTDPATFISVSALLLGVAFLACYLPAWRAARVDPLVALRYE
jgi:putative ABC transport system permease protein